MYSTLFIPTSPPVLLENCCGLELGCMERFSILQSCSSFCKSWLKGLKGSFYPSPRFIGHLYLFLQIMSRIIKTGIWYNSAAKKMDDQNVTLCSGTLQKLSEEENRIRVLLLETNLLTWSAHQSTKVTTSHSWKVKHHSKLNLPWDLQQLHLIGKPPMHPEFCSVSSKTVVKQNSWKQTFSLFCSAYVPVLMNHSSTSQRIQYSYAGTEDAKIKGREYSQAPLILQALLINCFLLQVFHVFQMWPSLIHTFSAGFNKQWTTNVNISAIIILKLIKFQIPNSSEMNEAVTSGKRLFVGAERHYCIGYILLIFWRFFFPMAQARD